MHGIGFYPGWLVFKLIINLNTILTSGEKSQLVLAFRFIGGGHAFRCVLRCFEHQFWRIVHLFIGDNAIIIEIENPGDIWVSPPALRLICKKGIVLPVS